MPLEDKCAACGGDLNLTKVHDKEILECECGHGIVKDGRTTTQLPRLDHIALSRRVLVVAKPGGLGYDWAAYIDAVDGNCHVHERDEVMRTGSKVSKYIAIVLFPQFNPDHYRW